jgi:hypothetical protein
MADLVLLASFSSRSEALIAQSLLAAEGLPAHMPDFNVLMADFDPSFMQSGWRLLIREDVLREALAVLRDAQLTPAEE